jgi:steroid delta-isomerase-like uncharacterized protein
LDFVYSQVRGNSMSTEDNKALIVRYFDFLNQDNLLSEEFLDSGFVYHDPGLQDVTDLASVREWVAAGLDAFPDQHSTIEDLVAEGDRVMCRYAFRATHQRDFRGIPATGKQTRGTAVAIYRIVGGKIQEEWRYSHIEA